MKNLDIKVEHVTRVEGHGNIVVKVRDGRVEDARLDIVESPRFFEVMLQGRSWQEASWITSRICGICAVTHSTASLKATEDAFGIVPSAQTVLLRKLLLDGEYIQSHVLHVYFLVAPDLLGVGSVVPLAGTHIEVVRMALRLKKLGNDLCALVGGRHVHPVAMKVNGFTSLPEPAGLASARERLVTARADLDATVELFKTLSIPAFTRETEYLSLKGVDEYPLYDGDMMSSDGYGFKPRGYLESIKETVVPPSSAKHVAARRDSYMVGALARFNNNHGLLHKRAKAVADAVGLSAPCHNPFMINVAQLVETVHCVEHAAETIDMLLGSGMSVEVSDVRPIAGRGVGVVEAPRGTLYHDYTYGADGMITGANCIIPTGQNLANIEADMQGILPGLLGGTEADVAQTLKMLVRAYDPCISCATHSIEVVFDRG
ncbi:MAG: Ni/Fe hydrogenase subunit alpha [Nitrospirae bacterium]|nr:Ni/Fe hydrogenase subunit alpha [Nitrospirota bacterium]